jgi:uncharacterized protein (TIGR03435 family)
MPELNDHELLAEFARTESETAFATLVARHVNLVYSTALRFTGNSHHAEEITQAVFVILARKAGKLSPRIVLSGWLYQAARLTAANLVKGEIRRQRREQEAYMQTILNEPDATTWKQIAPLLDDAMGGLGETDRAAVVLRFFENKTAAEVAAELKLTEGAAHKRVNRALEKLRKFFTKRGVSSTTAIIAGTISANSVQAAPVALAKTVTAVAIAKGAAASGSTLTLIKGALKIMAWTKVKTAIVAGAVVLLAAGTTTVTVKEIQEHKTYSWEVSSLDPSPMGAMKILKETPPQVRIVSSKYDHLVGGLTQGDTTKHDKSGKLISVTTNASESIGVGVTLDSIVETAYGSEPLRTIFSVKMPTHKYDYIANVPNNALQELQEEIKNKFGLIGRWEMVKTNVLAIRLAGQESEFTSRATQGYDPDPRNRFRNRYQLTLDSLKTSLQGMVSRDVPVIDQTGLTNQYQFSFAWPPGNISSDDRKQATSDALRDQLGLELVPTNMPIEMLVVEKAQ